MKEISKAGKPGGTVAFPGDKGTAGKPGGVVTTPGSKGTAGKVGGTLSWQPGGGGGAKPEKNG
jgi:hypothetical protein